MIESSHCGCNRYESERYNERRNNNERFGECRESRCGNTCGCGSISHGHCGGWRPAPVRPCRPCGYQPHTCGCSNVNSCHDEVDFGCECRPCPPRPCPPKPCPPRPCPPKPCPPRPCPPKPCPPKPCPPRPCPPKPCPPRPCPPKPCPPRPCRFCGSIRPQPYYDRMNEYGFYDEGMDDMPNEYWNDEYVGDYGKMMEVDEETEVEKANKE